MSLDSAYQESDFGSRAYLEQDDICRFCWSKGAQVFLFENIHENYNKDVDELISKVKNVLDIDLLSQDCLKHPNKVCNTCFTKINHFYDFKAFCQDSHRKLNEIFKNIDNEPNTYIDEARENIKLENYDDIGEQNKIDAEMSDDFLENLENSLHNEDRVEDPPRIERKFRNNSYKQKKTKYYCTICCFNFKNRDSYSKHLFESHGKEKNGLFKCFGCDKRFSSKKHRTNHERLFCKGLKDGYKCLICNRFLPQRRMYETHMRDHRDNKEIKLPEDIFKCKMCLQQFSSKESLENHKKTHTVEKKKFVCETCGRQFSRQDYLYRHGLTHSGAKPYSCPQCPFRTAQRSTLTTHIRKHTGERPYACPMCPQRCVTASNLLAHTRRHTAPPTYQCALCPKKFGYKTGLQEHIESVHEKIGHICPHCGVQYARIRGLKRHILAKHNETATKNDDKMQKDSLELVSERNIQNGGINDNKVLRETERQTAFQSSEVSNNTKIVLYTNNKKESELMRETERQNAFQNAEIPNSNAKIILYAGNNNESQVLSETELQILYQNKDTEMDVLNVGNNIVDKKENAVLRATERQTSYQAPDVGSTAKMAVLYVDNKNVSNSIGNSKPGPVFLKLSDKIVCLNKDKLYLAAQNGTSMQQKLRSQCPD